MAPCLALFSSSKRLVKKAWVTARRLLVHLPPHLSSFLHDGVIIHPIEETPHFCLIATRLHSDKHSHTSQSFLKLLALFFRQGRLNLFHGLIECRLRRGIHSGVRRTPGANKHDAGNTHSCEDARKFCYRKQLLFACIDK